MKYLYTCFFIIYSISMISQNENSSLDTIENSEQSLYIEKYHNQLNIKFDVSNEIKNYFIPYDGTTMEIAPNLALKYSFNFSYKFLSVRFGVRPRISESSKEEKGYSDIFEFRIKLLLNKWSHHFNYSYVKGFYVKNTNDFSSDDFTTLIQFPNLKTNTIYGTSSYKINNNYSVRAFESQTEIQIKSAGSLMPSVDYWLYKINDTSTFIDSNGETDERDNYKSFLGLNTIINLGYYYTFVYKKNWYANAYMAPGAGINIYQTTTHSPNGNSNNNFTDFVYSLQSGISLGYSSKNIFFGASFNNKFTNENNNVSEINFQTSSNAFHIFVGYRFKAPKTIRKPIDNIEEKIPILNQDNRGL